MDIFAIIGLLGLVLYVSVTIYTDTYWFRDIEKVFDDYAKKLEELAMKDREMASEGGKLFIETAERSEKQLKEFLNAFENYLRLKEKFRHDEKAKQVQKDWENYLKAIKVRLDCDMDYGILEGDRLRNVQRKDYEATIKMEEIGKRFKDLLKSSNYILRKTS